MLPTRATNRVGCCVRTGKGYYQGHPGGGGCHLPVILLQAMSQGNPPPESRQSRLAFYPTDTFDHTTSSVARFSRELI